jgi:hypothetical protein
MTEVEQAVLDAAVTWWRSRAPRMPDAEHFRVPHLNLNGSPKTKDLADTIVAHMKESDA